MAMNIFLDTAEIDEISDVASQIDGITTNPSLLRKAVEKRRNAGQAIDVPEYITTLCRTVGLGRSVSLEVIGLTAEEMISQGRWLYEHFNDIAGNVWVKIPITTATPDNPDRLCEGLRAIQTLANEGIPINTTLIMRPEQAVIAAYLGATVVSPFAGRIDDMLAQQAGIRDRNKEEYFPAEGLSLPGKGHVTDNGVLSGVHLVKLIHDAFEDRQVDTGVLAASLRNTRQVNECALVGADIATMPRSVYNRLNGATTIQRQYVFDESGELVQLESRLAAIPRDVFSAKNLGELLRHPKTEEGVKLFYDDALKVPEYAAFLDAARVQK